MKLMHPLFSCPIEFTENHIQVLTIEHPVLFRKMLGDVILQSEGKEGEFVLSDAGTCLDPAEALHPIDDYVHLEKVGKKIQIRVLNAVLRTAQEQLTKETMDLSRQIQQYLAMLAVQSEVSIAYEQGENLSALLKAMDVHLDFEGMSFPEALCEHIVVHHKMTKQVCIVLIRAKDVLSREEIMDLYQMACYQKWNLLLLEAHMQEERFPEEVHRLFDRDLCELLLDD